MSRSIFGDAFSHGVWATLVSLLIAGTLLLSFVLRRENNLPHTTSYAAKARLHKVLVRNAGIKADERRFIELQERWDLSEILLVVVGAICQQGCARDPSTAASRILYLSLLIMATLVITAFSAALTAGAGVSTQTLTCYTVGKINQRESVSLSAPAMSLTHDHDHVTLDQINTGLNMSNGDTYTTTTHGKSHEEPQGMPTFTQSPGVNETTKPGLIGFLKNLETGLAMRKKNKGPDKSPNQHQSDCVSNDQHEKTEPLFSSISLSDVWPALAQLVAGLSVALLLFGIEVAAGHRSTSHSPKASMRIQ